MLRENKMVIDVLIIHTRAATFQLFQRLIHNTLRFTATLCCLTCYWRDQIKKRYDKRDMSHIVGLKRIFLMKTEYFIKLSGFVQNPSNLLTKIGTESVKIGTESAKIEQSDAHILPCSYELRFIDGYMKS